MKIKDIELIPLQIPQKKIMRWADGHVTVTEHIIVKVIAEDGTYGVTEAIPRPGIYGETPVSIFNSLKNFIIPGIIGLDSFNLEKIWEKMDALPYNYAAKGSIDVAIHDLNGNGRLAGVGELHGAIPGHVDPQGDDRGVDHAGHDTQG